MKKIYALLLICAMAFSMSVTAFAADTNNTTTPEKVKITFVAEAQTAAIEQFVSSNDIIMDSFTITVDNTYTSGYVINNQDDFDALWSDFVTMQTALLNEGINNNESVQIGNDLQASLNGLASNDFQMAIVCDNPIPLTRNSTLMGADIVESIEPIETTSSEPMAAQNNASTRATNWVPTSGSASAWPSQNVSDATYLEARYKWNSASALSTLTNDSDSTFEADLVLYNYDQEALATNWYDGNYTYSTNQPRPYQDTQAFDNSDEPVFCIGCSDASALEANTEYYWIAYGNETGSDGCKAKLNMQRGHRVLDWIYEETWNIFGDETETVIPFSSWDTHDKGTATF